MSARTLAALSRALRLTPEEHERLYALAGAAAGGPGTAGDSGTAPGGERRSRQRVRPGLRRVLDSLGLSPALVLGRRLDVLAWNRAAAALFTDFAALPPARRNLAALVFLDPHARCLFADWEHAARRTLADLRAAAVRHPDDLALAGLVGELAVRSEEFGAWWAAGDDALPDGPAHGTVRFRHPAVGALALTYETFRPPDDADQVLVTFTAATDTPDADGLRLLDMLG